MKTKLLLFTCMLVSAIVIKTNAQTQPPNAGFENWVSIGPYENPANWSSFNNFYIYDVPEMSFKTIDANSGTYALRLISDTATVPPPLGTNVMDTMAGFVFLGSSDMSNPGISYTERPVLMQAYVKGTIMPGGNAIILATLRKWNTVTHARDQVGGAMYNMTSSSANYSQITAAFNYSLPDNPDTLEIKIMAGDVGPGGKIVPGNIFYVDDISFTFPVGINESTNNNLNIYVFPNPATDRLNIESKQQSSIEVFNVEGQIIKSFVADNTHSIIDISSFEKGIYFVKVITENGTDIRRFVKM